MADETLFCGKCEAPLEVSATTFSVACESCGQWHLIDRTGDVAVANPFDEPDEVAAPAESTGVAAPESESPGVTKAKIDEEIERLDRAWERERQKHLVIGLTGSPSTPDASTAVVVGAVGLIFAVFLFSRSAGLDLSGLAFVAACLGFAVVRWRKAQAYEESHRRYQRQRRMSSQPPPPNE